MDLDNFFQIFYLILWLYTSSKADAEVTKDDCNNWSNSIDCKLPCNFLESACLVDIEEIDTYLTCQWETIPEIDLYRIFLDEKGNLNKSTCGQLVRCPGSKPCTSKLWLHRNNSDCLYFYRLDRSKPFVFKALDKDFNEICHKLIPYNLCETVDLGQPIVSTNRLNATSVQLSLGTPKCPNGNFQRETSSITYNIEYSKGQHKIQSKYLEDSDTVELDLQEASVYQISVKYKKDLISKWSSSTSLFYQTAPVSAIRVEKFKSAFNYSCIRSQNGEKRIEISWKKIGVLSNSNVTITKFNQTSVLNTEHQKLNLIGDNNTTTTFTMLNYSAKNNYTISVTSENKAGTSKPVVDMINYDLCADKTDFYMSNCSVKELNYSSAIVKWKSVKKPDSYLIEIISNDSVNYQILDRNRTSYLLKDYLICVIYKINIYPKIHGQTLNCCSKEFVKFSEPNAYKVKDIQSRQVRLETNSTLNCDENEYEVVYNTSQDFFAVSLNEDLKLTNLKPFTEYSLKIRQVYLQYKGDFGQTIYFKTKQDAPSKPPVFKVIRKSGNQLMIVWKVPKEVNGIVSSYFIKIENNKIQDKQANCEIESNNEYIVCSFSGNTYSFTINVSVNSTIKMKACTERDSFCSKWSAIPYVVKEVEKPYFKRTNFVWIVFGVTCLIVLVLFGRHQLGKKQIPKPKLESEIVESFQLCKVKTHHDQKDNRCQEKYSLIPKMEEELLDSVLDWRGRNDKNKEVISSVDQSIGPIDPDSYCSAILTDVIATEELQLDSNSDEIIKGLSKDLPYCPTSRLGYGCPSNVMTATTSLSEAPPSVDNEESVSSCIFENSKNEKKIEPLDDHMCNDLWLALQPSDSHKSNPTVAYWNEGLFPPHLDQTRPPNSEMWGETFDQLEQRIEEDLNSNQMINISQDDEYFSDSLFNRFNKS